MSPDGGDSSARTPSAARGSPAARVSAAAPARFAVWSGLGLCALLTLGTFAALALAGTTAAFGSPLDAGGASGSWAAMRTGLLFVGEIGAQVAGLVLPVAVVWLVLRRAWMAAWFTAVAGLGAVVLIMAIDPLAQLFTAAGLGGISGTHFPNAVALGITVTGGTFLLVFLPVIPVRRRGIATALATVVVLAAGASVVALQPAIISVLVGWVLGVLWLGVITLGFNRLRRRQELPALALGEGLMPEERPQLTPAPAQDRPVAATAHAGAKLAGVTVVIGAVLVGAGLLITEVLAGVRRFDQAVIDWFASIHSPAMTAVATFVGELGDTAGIIAVLLVTVPLSLAITRRWTPALFLTVLPVGETALYLTVSTIVGRSRPVLEQASELPPTASFPSGHTAASLVTYGGIALLLMSWSRSRWRYAAVPIAAVVVLGVALSRLYDGVHYPTDTLFSMLYGLIWLAVCWRVFRPGRAAPLREVADDGARQIARMREADDGAWQAGRTR